MKPTTLKFANFSTVSVLGTSLILAVLTWAPVAHAQDRTTEAKRTWTSVACGDVLSEPGYYELDRDLDCSATIKIVTSNVHFDLGGHTITCNQETWVHDPANADDPNPWVTGIQVNLHEDSAVSGLVITNGSIANCSQGLLLWNTTHSLVTRMNLIDNTLEGECCNAKGLELTLSSNNEIRGNAMVGNQVGTGLYDGSNGNRFINNRMNGNQLDGADLWFSNDNRFVANSFSRNGDTGVFLVSGSGNLFRGNRVNDNSITGIWAASLVDFEFPRPFDNKFHANTVIGNGLFDMLDSEYFDTSVFPDEFVSPGPILEPCLNVWKSNRHDTEYGPANCID